MTKFLGRPAQFLNIVAILHLDQYSKPLAATKILSNFHLKLHNFTLSSTAPSHNIFQPGAKTPNPVHPLLAFSIND